MHPEIGQVVTVFRSRLRPDASEYPDDAAAHYSEAYSISVGTTERASSYERA